MSSVTVGNEVFYMHGHADGSGPADHYCYRDTPTKTKESDRDTPTKTKEPDRDTHHYITKEPDRETFQFYKAASPPPPRTPIQEISL